MTMRFIKVTLFTNQIRYYLHVHGCVDLDTPAGTWLLKGQLLIYIIFKCRRLISYMFVVLYCILFYLQLRVINLLRKTVFSHRLSMVQNDRSPFEYHIQTVANGGPTYKQSLSIAHRIPGASEQEGCNKITNDAPGSLINPTRELELIKVLLSNRYI